MLISFIIPVYNTEDYIEQTLESIIDQTEKDFEIIVVDDGSTDKSYEKALHTLKKSGMTNWRIIRQENRGVSSARNRGLLEASGDYIVFVDSDDLVSKELVKKVKQIAMDYEYDIIAWKFARRNVQGEKFVSFKPFTEMSTDIKSSGINVLYNILSNQMSISIWSAAFKRSFLMENQLLLTPGAKYSEDVEFVYKCLFFAKKVYFLNDYLYYYTVNPKSVTQKDADLSVFHSYGSAARLIKFAKRLERTNSSNDCMLRDLIRKLEIRSYERLAYTVFRIYISKKVDNKKMLHILSNKNIREKLRKALVSLSGRKKKLFTAMAVFLPARLVVSMRPLVREILKKFWLLSKGRYRYPA